MKKLLKTNSLILVLVLMFNMLFPVLSMATDENVTVTFQDENLYNAVVTELGSKVASKEDSTKTITITQGNLETVTTLTLYNKEITNISGIEKFTHLTKLYLNVNEIADISAIKTLTKLEWLNLAHNKISDITPVARLTSLVYLGLNGNEISNIEALSNLIKLRYLYLGDNKISDISALSKLTNLNELSLNKNNISDISILEGKNIGSIDIKEQKMSVQTAVRENIKLPNIFVQAKNTNSIAYTDDELKLEGCVLNSEKTAITLNSDVTNAKVTLFKNSGDRNGVAGSEFVVQFNDDVPPIIEVRYSTTVQTNQNVTVTITANEQLQQLEGWILSTDGLMLTKVYAQNATEEVTVKDLAGNERKVQVQINNIDATTPQAKVEYSTTELTKETVQVTIKANEKLQQLEGWSLSTDGLFLTKVYAQNVSEEVTVKDLAGNEVKVSVLINNVDSTAPQAEIQYSTTEATKESVTVTIVANEKLQEVQGWTLSADGLVLTKVYTQNTIDEVITIRDLIGNERVIPLEITNIDTDIPEAKVEYSVTEATKENVTVTITVNEKVQQLEGWTLAENETTLTKVYTKNTEEQITLKDLAGNEIKVSVKVSNIDLIAPDVEVEYSTTKKTDGKVTVTITANEEVQQLEGWTLSNDKQTLTKVYTKNAEEEIILKDLAGNETKVSIKVSNIVNQTDDEKEDNTVAGGEIPQAGQNMVVIVSILAIVILGIVSYTRLRRVKDVK